jgi:thymidylate kinase
MITSRDLFLQGFANVLSRYSYVMLKFIPDSLTDLETQSDLDIGMSYQHSKELFVDIQSHHLVETCRSINTSYMNVITVYFEDGSFISIDCIYRFMRKSIQYLTLQEALENSYTDANGLNRARPKLDLCYSLLFYNLNNSDIPEKYKNHFLRDKSITNENLLSEIDERFNLDIGDFNQIFKLSSSQKRKLKKWVTKKPGNIGLERLVNIAKYVLDTGKRGFRNNGLILTFTGVDGAGKSTIISDVYNELTNTYREDVVLLRHRPGILPILSSFRHGKSQADHISATHKPRQGSNKSTIGSLARFMYYFSDFLLGQIYIHFAHVMRGRIVLYDRYYFDFVVDMKRSNLYLAKSIPKALYRMITKPDINYFLFASPEEILKRN